MAPVDDTLRTMALILGGVFGFSWLALGLSSRYSLRYALNFFVANLCVAAGVALVTQRTTISNFFTAQLADWLGVGGITAFASGVLLMSDVRPAPLWMRLFPVVCEITLTIGLPADDTSYYFRAVVFNATATLTALLASESCLRNAGVQGGAVIRLLVATPFLLAGILFGLRGIQLAVDWWGGDMPVSHAYRSYTTFLWGYIIVFVVANISNAGMVVAKLLARLNRLAERDTLTGCLNRRALLEKLDACLASFKRHQRPLSCSLLDLDYFKSINDRYGHEAGDAALSHTTSLIKEQLRALDEIGRYGGEEFIVVMPDTSLAGAQCVVERIRTTLQATPFIFCGSEIPLSASFGVAELMPGETQEELLRRADLCMYEAKSKGRNCVVVSGKTALPD